MTQPAVIFVGPDAPRHKGGRPLPKIYLRALLFATAKRGCVIESMHATLQRNESHQTFNIWAHGDERLVRGSGLFVGETGLAANHHFLIPNDGSAFQFLSGTYRLNVYVRLLGVFRQRLLFSHELTISPELADSLIESGSGIFLDWGPDSSRYLPHVEKPPPAADRTRLFESLALAGGIESTRTDLHK